MALIPWSPIKFPWEAAVMETAVSNNADAEQPESSVVEEVIPSPIENSYFQDLLNEYPISPIATARYADEVHVVDPSEGDSSIESIILAFGRICLEV
jgi:hypothetical protein